MKQEVNNRFIDGLEALKKKGVSFVAMARSMGVPKQKVIDIRHGRSSADELLLSRLLDAYPELVRDGEIPPMSPERIQSEIAARDAELEKLAKEVAGLEKLLKKANTEKEDTQKELKRAMDIIEKQTNTINALLKKQGVIE
ncbi:MAG: hypothetical protein KDD19_09805 [Phaeodactylibacter sp.]|nr:hypothetical protein [Phaeodactylibacter sp.]MCB9050447.1 hypothetical protein [Lewinellaceae bacterium]